LPFDVFKSFVLYAPPGTAVFHHRNQGWLVGDHLAAFQLDVLNRLWWAKTVDGQKDVNRPAPTPRPGTPETGAAEDDSSPFTVTVEDYLRMVAEAEDRED
jgi:hypothetical protein